MSSQFCWTFKASAYTSGLPAGLPLACSPCRLGGTGTNGNASIAMSRENLTLDCPAHLFKNWEAADGRLSGLWLADNVSANQTVLSAVLLGTLVLVLCFTASNVYLRRTRSAAACVRRGFPGNNQVESTKVVPLISQTWMKWLSTLQRAFDPRWILRKCVFWGVSGPQVAGRGASKQDSINPCRFAPEIRREAAARMNRMPGFSARCFCVAHRLFVPLYDELWVHDV